MSLKEQLDRIEGKLDRSIARSIKNETDLIWMKGAIKIGIPVVISTVGYIITKILQG